MQMKTLLKIGIAGGAVIAGIGITLAVLNPTNVAETGEKSGELQTRRYKIHEKDFSDAVEDIKFLLAGQTTYGRGWRVVDSKIENNTAVVKAEVPVVVFTDDLEVRLSFEPAVKEMIVNAQSSSRVGQSDLGENRRHIRQILDVMDTLFLGY